jgi:hypothetical protein
LNFAALVFISQLSAHFLTLFACAATPQRCSFIHHAKIVMPRLMFLVGFVTSFHSLSQMQKVMTHVCECLANSSKDKQPFKRFRSQGTLETHFMALPNEVLVCFLASLSLASF